MSRFLDKSTQNWKLISLAIVAILWIGFIGYWCYDFLARYGEIKHAMRGEILRGIGMFFVGVGIAPVGLLLAAIRTNTSQAQSHIEKQRLVSEDFSRSVKLLGDASAAVRQGGIYALGFLAQESRDRYETAIKIIASYIRETRKSKDAESEEINIVPDGVDVEAALSVIKNRNTNWDNIPNREGEYMFDLSSSKIRYGDLSNARLRHVNLSEIDAGSCIFAKAIFSKANIVSATFRGCDFENALFCGAQLRESRFWHDKHLGGSCNFRGVDLTGAELHAADLRGVDYLTQEQINSANGDEKTELPMGLTCPKHWLKDSGNLE